MAYTNIMTIIYPVGSIYQSINNTSPSTLFGGQWVAIQDRFLVGAGEAYSGKATGGEATHKLTIAEMPSHQHGNPQCWKWEASSGYNTGTAQITDNITAKNGNTQVQSSFYTGGRRTQQHAALLRRLHVVSPSIDIFPAREVL